MTLSNYALVSDVQTALSDKLKQSDLNIINHTLRVLNNFKSDKSYVDNALALKANQSDLNAALNLKADKTDITTLNNTVNSLQANKTNNADFITFSQNITNQLNNIVFPKPKVTINAEENGNTSYNAYEWSFGNGGENNKYSGWPSPANGRILCGAMSSTAGSQAPGEMEVMIVVNGNEAGNNYLIIKPNAAYSSHFTFNTPLEINAGNRINFRSETSNGSVTHSVVSLIIELDL